MVMIDIARHRSSQLPSLRSPVAATLGNFDGIHRGHQEIIAHLRQWQSTQERRGDIVVVSFYPHPLQVLRGTAAPKQLTTLRQSLRIYEALGVRLLYLIHFTPAFSRLTAEQFMEQCLLERLSVRHLAVGPDARIGKDRSGGVPEMRSFLESHGGTLQVVDFLSDGGERVSSRRIRSLVEDGQVELASELLGRPFALSGRVSRGDRRGAGIGFPTANLLPGKQEFPGRGVYATKAGVRGKTYPAVTNVGIRPTFNGETLRAETHILGSFQEDIYHQHLSVSFCKKLRDEMKFRGPDELIDQIRQDIIVAQEYFAQRESN